MSFELGKDYTSTPSYTPALNYLKSLEKQTPKIDMLPIIEETSQKRKELLELDLNIGKEIHDEKTFQNFINLLKKNNIIDVKTSFQEINDGNPVVIQYQNFQEKEKFPLAIFYLHPDIQKGINARLGFIDNKGTFIKSRNKNHILTYSPIPDIIPIQETSSNKTLGENKNITIKKGDTLWKLIEKHYDIPNDNEKNRNIANIALRLGKLKENKGTIKNGLFFPGKILFFPNEISTIRLPNKEEKRFNLKQETK